VGIDVQMKVEELELYWLMGGDRDIFQMKVEELEEQLRSARSVSEKEIATSARRVAEAEERAATVDVELADMRAEVERLRENADKNDQLQVCIVFKLQFSRHRPSLLLNSQTQCLNECSGVGEMQEWLNEARAKADSDAEAAVASVAQAKQTAASLEQELEELRVEMGQRQEEAGRAEELKDWLNKAREEAESSNTLALSARQEVEGVKEYARDLQAELASLKVGGLLRAIYANYCHITASDADSTPWVYRRRRRRSYRRNLKRW
jgi:chromosome segregation ATPase